MIPVDQTITGPKGNCMSACIASLLHLPIEHVARFIREPEDTHIFQWADRLDDFLEPYGLYALHFAADPERAAFPGVLHIMTGISPRGRPHAVIGKGRCIVHDPHPDKTGLVSVDGFCLLVPRWENVSAKATSPIPPSARRSRADGPGPHRVFDSMGRSDFATSPELLDAARSELERLLASMGVPVMPVISCAGARRADGSYIDTRPPGRGLLMEGEPREKLNAVEVGVDRREAADQIRANVGDEIMGVPIVYSAREEWQRRIR